MKTAPPKCPSALLIGVVLAVGSCEDDVKGGDRGLAGACEDRPASVGALIDPTPIGISAAEFLDVVTGLRRSPLTWKADRTLIRMSPADGSTDLVVEATAKGVPRHVDSVPVNRAPNQRLACFGRLEVDAEVKLRTADGALDETWSGVLAVLGPAQATTASASFAIDLIASPPKGSFRVEWIDLQPGDRVSLLLSVTMFRDRTQGQITLSRSRQAPAGNGRGGGSGEGASVANWSRPAPGANAGDGGTSEPPPATTDAGSAADAPVTSTGGEGGSGGPTSPPGSGTSTGEVMQGSRSSAPSAGRSTDAYGSTPLARG
jgi:hypothetical protein